MTDQTTQQFKKGDRAVTFMGSIVEIVENPAPDVYGEMRVPIRFLPPRICKTIHAALGAIRPLEVKDIKKELCL